MSDVNETAKPAIVADPRVYAAWCPLQTIRVRPNNSYVILPNITTEQLTATLNYLEQQIRTQEMALRQAERAADNASRASNANRSRQTGSFFSATRSLQGIRHSLSEMSRTMLEKQVNLSMSDINELHDLKFRLEEELRRGLSAGRTTADLQNKKPRARNFCRTCGSTLLPGDAFCGECGAAIG